MFCTSFLILLLLQVCVSAIIKCPDFCSCDKWQGLRRITCSGRRLGSSEVNAPFQVQALDLSNNSISLLRDKGFSHYHQLKYLNLSYNKITDIHMSALHGLTELNVLDLTNNHLKFLMPIAFEDTPVLQELYLSGNEIGHFGKTPIFNIPALQILHMKECLLETMDELTFSQLPNLMDLDLSDNQFVALKMGYLRSLSELNTLNLSGNPWHCNPEIQVMLSELSERNVIVTPICEKESRKELSENTSNMFERMVSIKDSSESNSEFDDDIETLGKDIYSIWFDQTSGDSETDMFVEDEDEKNSDTEVNFMDNFMEQIPSFWAFLLGLQIGSVLGIIGMWVWLRCKCSQVPAQPPIRTRSRRLSQSLRRSIGRSRVEDSSYTELAPSDCPGTPPPPYRDVVLCTFR